MITIDRYKLTVSITLTVHEVKETEKCFKTS